ELELVVDSEHGGSYRQRRAVDPTVSQRRVRRHPMPRVEDAGPTSLVQGLSRAVCERHLTGLDAISGALVESAILRRAPLYRWDRCLRCPAREHRPNCVLVVPVTSHAQHAGGVRWKSQLTWRPHTPPPSLAGRVRFTS